jgi:hypothetical protein
MTHNVAHPKEADLARAAEAPSGTRGGAVCHVVKADESRVPSAERPARRDAMDITRTETATLGRDSAADNRLPRAGVGC